MPQQRIKSFDSLKGLMMFLVVLGHLMLFSYGGNPPILHHLYASFDVAVFFFVSGIFFGVRFKSTVKDKSLYIFRKAVYLLFPAFVFSQIGHLKDGKFSAIITDGFGFYWFLPALFWSMFTLYAIDLLTNLLKKPRIYDCIVYTLGAILIVCNLVFNDIPRLGFVQLNSVVAYLPFLIIGGGYRGGNQRIMRLLDAPILSSLLVLTAVVSFVLYLLTIRHCFDSFIDLSCLKDLFVSLCILACFFRYQHCFESESKINSFLALVGRYTLPIYLLHYYFLPDLNWLRCIIGENSTVLVLLILIVIAVAIIGLCVSFTKIISTSDFFGHYLLGQKSNKFKI